MRARVAFLLLCLVAGGCAVTVTERRDQAYVFGWTGVPTSTSNPGDPYLEGYERLLRGCPADEACFVDQARRPTHIVSIALLPPAPRIDETFMTEMHRRIGHDLRSSQLGTTPSGHRYWYGTARAPLVGEAPAAFSMIAANAFGSTYALTVLADDPWPEQAMVRLLESVRFPR